MEYPLELNVADWCEPTARSAISAAASPANHAQGLPAFPSYPLAGASTYRLQAVVLHYGRYRHYTCVTKVRVPRKGEGVDIGWAEFDDRASHLVEEKALFGGDAREAAYLLLYVKA